MSEISQTTTGGSTKQDSAYYRAFVNDSAGNAVYINQGGGQQQIVQTQSGPMQGTVAVSRLVNPNSGWEGGWVGGPLGTGHIQRQIVVQGQVIARYGDTPKLDVSMEGLNATGGTGTQPGTNSTPVTYANTVEVNLTAPGVNRGVGQQGVSLHTAQEGDTLQSIAQTRLGDSRLWYLIADANSLTVTGDAKLQAGQTLRIPSTTLNANRADTFEPWDPAKAIGSQQPNMPIPAAADGACGGFGSIIIAAIAIVVAAVTQQWYLANVAGAGAGGAAAGGVAAAGTTSVSTGALATSAAVGAATGSVVSQAAANVLGMQNGFNWKSVGLSAISGAIGGAIGVGSSGDAFTTAAQSAAANALTQGAGVVLGLQKSFDWRGVAASAVGGGIGKAVGNAMGLSQQSFQSLSMGEQFGARLATGFAAGAATALARGGRVAIQQVATDAFGNALGQGLLDVMAPSDLLGDFIAQRESQWQKNQVYGLGSMGAKQFGLTSTDTAVSATSGLSEYWDESANGESIGGNGVGPLGSSGLSGLSEYTSHQLLDPEITLPETIVRAQRLANGEVIPVDRSLDLAEPAVDFSGVGAVGYLGGAAEIALGGVYNQFVKIGGGLASIPYLLDGVDAAVAVQEAAAAKLGYRMQSYGAMAIAGKLAPVGEFLQNNIATPVSNYSEYYLGDGLTTVLGAGLQIGFESFGTVTGLRAAQSFGTAVLENAFTGPVAGSRSAQIGGVNLNSPRYKPGVATFGNDLVIASGRWLDATVPTPVPLQVATALEGKTFRTFGDMQSAVWKTIANDADLAGSFNQGSLGNMLNGNAPFAPRQFRNGQFGERFNLHHVDPIGNGWAVYDLSNLRIVTPAMHSNIHYPKGQK